jgi:hypothetical protein
MIRLREPLRKLLREWVPYDELARLPASTRLVLLGLMAWSGVAIAAIAGGLLGIEIAARSIVPVAAKEARPSKSERSNGNATLQRPVFSRTRQAPALAVARPPAPPLPPPPPPVLAARDSDLRLKGVFMSAPVVKAFLISAQNPVGAWVKPQEVFGGWKLVEVRPSEIELESGGERVTLPLGAGGSGNEQKNIVQNFRPNPQFRR